MEKGRRDMQLFFAGPTLNWVYIVRSLHRYSRMFYEPTLVPQLVVYIAAALTCLAHLQSLGPWARDGVNIPEDTATSFWKDDSYIPHAT